MTFDPQACQTTVFEALLEARSRHGGSKLAVEDADRQRLTYDRLILGSLVLGSKLTAGTGRGETVGVLLPNVAGMAVTYFALNAFGRVPAILNFTAGQRNVVSAARTALLHTVVTARRFVEAAKLEPIIAALEKTEIAPGKRMRIVYLEDIRSGIGALDKALGLLRSKYAKRFHRSQGGRADSPGVVLFTSGTEGHPKGVVLTNANLVANARQMFAHADGAFTAADIVINPLPMFHSFGLTAGTIMPLVSGMQVVLYPTPLHYRQIPKLVRDKKATVLFATDTFLLGYARAADPGDLASLRFVVAGAERVKDQTRKLWQQIGTEVLEGYGATECAPVIACNLPGSNRPGTVGRVLPGMEVALDPVEGIATGGRLKVRGPNVMAGYVFAEHPGVVRAPPDGWHDTGDIVDIDDDGFIAIKGRAKRFAKIGGEMVSLAAVEALAANTWPDGQHVVVNLPDERKGEQLILVTDVASADKDVLLEHARIHGFPELWVPRHILVVATIPVLGSGKIDLPAAAALVRQARP
ncbi:MAG: AMP-binding protein, partial [Alphaproteobacteria bacterium]|nr:AMP-binding protein [Alphaproteobacteria bacterium]